MPASNPAGCRCDPVAFDAVNYVPNTRVSLRTHPIYNERWLQARIAENPAMLGLGDVDVRELERTQPRAGRLDMLLSDPDTATRYEVEIQLGATDESHIIRTIEYWDIERRRYPQYDHVAVIVAEEITARFFNVISLFNGFIPIIAIQAQAIQVDEQVTLVFTTVLDRVTLGDDDDDGPDEPRDRSYWEGKSSIAMLAQCDRLLDLIREVEPGAILKYNKHYIGLSIDGVATNFVTFRPRRAHVNAEFKISRADPVAGSAEEAGLTTLAYQTRWGRFRVQLTADEIGDHADVLRELIGVARASYGLSD